MSTRSYIVKQNPDGTYEGVYCHNDGYLTYNGAMLLDHYNSRERVDKLLSLGDISSLRVNIEPLPSLPHTFDDQQDDVTVFYGRDRGDKDAAKEEVRLEDIDSDSSWIEYCYVYGLDDKWRYVEKGRLSEGLKDLEEGLNEEYRRLGFSRPEGYYGFFTQEDIEKYRYEDQKEKEGHM